MLIRVFLALDPPSLRNRLARLVAEPAVVSLSGGRDVLGRALAGESFDLGLVDREALGRDPEPVVRELLRSPDRTELIVLRRGEDGADRAALLAAGCLAVLDHELPDRSLAEALQALLARRRTVLMDRLRADDWRRSQGADVVAASPAMKKVLAAARRVANACSPVLLLGETGAGKEWLARQIHALGLRSGERFYAVNCAAVPENLIESELFGHVKGAFTGADRPRRGCFELAHRGTLLLDEIGDMPPHLQSRLLRALEDGEVRRVGSEEALPVDVRVIAATSRDLAAARAGGHFRDDLFYRLAVITLEVPPLRKRPEDLEPLAELLVRRIARKLGRPPCRLDRSAIGALSDHSWPGNVRELINLLERTVLFLEGHTIAGDDIRGHFATRVSSGDGRGHSTVDVFTRLVGGWTDKPFEQVRSEALSELERRYLDAQLRSTGGRIGDAAQRAGLTTRSVHRMMARAGLKKEDYRREGAEVVTTLRRRAPR